MHILLQRYVDHAICLKNTIMALRYNKKVLSLPDCDGGIDLIRCERINTLDEATRLRVLFSSPFYMTKKIYGNLFHWAVIGEELRRPYIHGTHFYGNRGNDSSYPSPFWASAS